MKRYRGFKWYSARDAAFTAAIIAVIVAIFCTMNALDKREAAKLAEREDAQPKEIEAVVLVQKAVKPVSVPEVEVEPEATPETKSVLIYNVPLDADLQLFIIEQAEAHDIDPAIIVAMAFRESSYDASAIGDDGKSFGLLQVQTRWHKDRMERLGVTDLFDPFQNVTVSVDYLAEQINRYDGDIAKALVAYNNGDYEGTITQYAVNVLETAEELRGEINAIYG